MKHSEFLIGDTFWCGRKKWRCTDLGTRTVIAICLTEVHVTSVVVRKGSRGVQTGPEQHEMLTEAKADAQGWFKGPPYAVAESVFDEYDIGGCTVEQETE